MEMSIPSLSIDGGINCNPTSNALIIKILKLIYIKKIAILNRFNCLIFRDKIFE